MRRMIILTALAVSATFSVAAMTAPVSAPAIPLPSAAPPAASAPLPAVSSDAVFCPQAVPVKSSTNIFHHAAASHVDYSAQSRKAGVSSGKVFSGSHSAHRGVSALAVGNGLSAGGFYSTSSYIADRYTGGGNVVAAAANSSVTSNRRQFPSNPRDPFLNPVGDFPLALLALLSAAFCIFRYLRARKRA